MPFRASNALDAPPPSGGYSQAVETTGARRFLFVSGQVPVDADGIVPDAFEEQARLAWRNVERQLAAAGMDLAGIVKHTTYLARREGREANGRVRREILGDLEPALTVVIAGIFDESWLLEIEAIAAA
jgi:enamine deaminase RidA (YjgF/YER057c/UK114 family)